MQIEPVHAGYARETLFLTVLLAMMCVISGCAGVKERPRETMSQARSRQTAPLPPVSPALQTAPPSPDVPKASIVAATPIPAGTLSVRSECTSRDQTGYTESIKLAVDQGRVDLLEAKIDIPRRGSCGFRLADFRQTRSEPHVELQSSTGSMCTVRMWQQGERFTVAFNDCQEKCTRGAFEYVWPMNLNSADGSCL